MSLDAEFRALRASHVKAKIPSPATPIPTQAAGPSSSSSVPFPNEHHCLRLARLTCPLARLEFTQLLSARSLVFGWLQRGEVNPTLLKPFPVSSLLLCKEQGRGQVQVSSSSSFQEGDELLC